MTRIKESHVTIMVSDMDKAVTFYKNIGFELKHRWNYHYAMMTAPGITIGLHPSDDPATSSATVSIGFMIDSIEETKAFLDTYNIACSGR